MAEVIACLSDGRVILLQAGQARAELDSRHALQQSKRSPPVVARIVDVARGRRNDELCYVVSAAGMCSVFTQALGTGEARRLFTAEAEIRDLDFSFADEALACTVTNKDGTTAIAMLADDGKGMRTITEGDVLDREPRWAPDGRGEILYASAGIGRSRSGVKKGLGPSSLHRLRLSDSTVEVLVSDARYDYQAPVSVSKSLIYALRSSYDSKPQKSRWAKAAGKLLAPFARPEATRQTRSSSASGTATHGGSHALAGNELIRITDKDMGVLASHVRAFDATAAGLVVYSTSNGVFRCSSGPESSLEQIADITDAEQVVICG